MQMLAIGKVQGLVVGSISIYDPWIEILGIMNVYVQGVQVGA